MKIILYMYNFGTGIARYLNVKLDKIYGKGMI